MDALILGCGYLGRRVAALWIAEGRRVAAVTRSRAEELTRLGVEPILGDVCGNLHLPSAKTVLYAIGLDRTSSRSMREVYVNGLANALTALPRDNRLIYVSSTSVYGQTDGGWVDESSATEPLEESGRIVLEAETVLKSIRPDAVILHFAGIYGPQRLLREKSIRAGEPLGGDPSKWLNLIHVADGARAVLAAENAPAGEMYLVADDKPVTRFDYYSHLAQLLKAPSPNFDGSPALRETHRRICNAKLRALGFDLAFPNYRAGLVNAVPGS